MPGFAIQGSSGGVDGAAKGVHVTGIGAEGSLGVMFSNIFTATKKTRVTSLTAFNKYGGILPVTLAIWDGPIETVLFTSRVFKSKELVMATVDQDARVGADKLADFPHTEIVLQPGQSLVGKSPIAFAVDVSLTVFEGIS